MKRILFVALLALASFLFGGPTGLSARFSKGKTFITFTEDAGTAIAYRVYASGSPITSVSGAAPLAVLQTGSGYDRVFNRYHVISDLGSPLAPGVGLFVNTPKSARSAWYAVTAVAGGIEDTLLTAGANTLASPVTEESWINPGAVLVSVAGPETGTRTYTYYHWMDYASWPNSLEYYGNFFVVNEDISIRGKQKVPLFMYLHALSCGAGMPDEVNGAGFYPLDMLRLTPKDPGDTWWYGRGANPYTENRIVAYLRSIIKDPRFSVDTNRVYVRGQSMGGSGTMTLTLHHPELIAAAHPMLAPISSAMMAVVTDHPETDFPPIIDAWGSKDSQDFGVTGHRLLYRTFASQHQGVFGKWFNVGHVSPGNNPDIVKGFYPRFRRNETFPALSNATRDWNYGQFTPNTCDSTGYLNSYIDWTSSLHDMGLKNDDLIDCADSLSITLVSYLTNTLVDVTPRRIQRFPVTPGASYSWRSLCTAGDTLLKSGTVIASAQGKISILQLPLTRTGVRLVIKRVETAAERTPLPVTPAALHSGPNPFRSWLSLSFHFSGSKRMPYRLFDASGRPVRSFQVTSGVPLAWDGKDDLGRELGSGLFIGKLKTPEGAILTHRLIRLP